MKRKEIPNVDLTPPVVIRSKPEKMITLTCKSCRMALYLSDRTLSQPTWKCPSCGVTTRTKISAN